jgi:gas vesicle protein
MAEKTCAGDFVAGFVVGALAGAAAALLLAPMSGEETRVMIREKGVELGHRADEVSIEARKRAEELQVQAKERAGAFQERVKVAVDEGKAAATKTKEDLLAQVGQGDAVVEEAPAEEATPAE